MDVTWFDVVPTEDRLVAMVIDTDTEHHTFVLSKESARRLSSELAYQLDRLDSPESA